MGASLTTRIILKVKRTVRELDRSERQFARVWPQIAPIGGWLYEPEAKWLFKRAFSLADRANLVEIGSYKGRSTICLGFGCRGTKKRVFAVDTFDGGPDLQPYDSFEEFSANVKRCELTEYIEPVREISWMVAKTWNRPIHFLFIDGSHIYEDVMADFASFFPHVIPGGVVAFHDVDQSFPDVLRAWSETFKAQLTQIGYCGTLAFGMKPRK